MENKWTIKNILKGKTILFIIITLLLTKVFYEFANKGLNMYLNQFNDHPLYTHNYSFGKYGLILIIPAAIFTILILKLYVKMRNKPYNNESALSPDGLRDSANKIKAILTHKLTKYVLITAVLIFSIYLLINFAKAFLIFFPLPFIEKFMLRTFLMPTIYLIIAIYIGSIIFMGAAAFSKEPMKKSSKYSARFGFLSLVFLLAGVFGLMFSIFGIISSIIGMIRDQGIGRRTALFGFLSSFITLIVLSGIIVLGYIHLTG